MNFEDMQNAWGSQGEGFKMRIDSLLLLHEIESKHRHFSVMIFCRDFFVCFVAFLLSAIFLYAGIQTSLLKSFLIPAAACAWVGTFIIGDRLYQKRKYKLEPVSVREAIEFSLHEVSHQVWLLKNVPLWCLLPFAMALAVVFIAMFRMAFPMLENPSIGHSLDWLSGCALFFVVDLWGIYKGAQVVIRKKLLPRKRELEDLLAGFSEQA